MQFYRDVLGLTLIEKSPYALDFMGGAHMLRVQIVSSVEPIGHTVHGWQVSDISTEIESLTSKGVTFIEYEFLQQDGIGVWTTPDGNKIAWFKDPNGNTLSLTESAQPALCRSIYVRISSASWRASRSPSMAARSSASVWASWLVISASRCCKYVIA